jgi:DNA segregation ATPase FtsK/SpoIIIE, S-DNA-T family
LARVKSSIERAATLHRQAVATADAAAGALDLFAPSVSPSHLVAAQRSLAATLVGLAEQAAPGWLGAPLEGTVTLPTGTHSDEVAAVRVGTATPLPDAPFPVIVPLLGVGHLAVEGARHDLRTTALLRNVLLRLIAATTPGALRIRAVDTTGIAFASFQPLFDGRVMPSPVADLHGMRSIVSEAEQWVRVPAPPGHTLLVVIAGRPDGADDTDLARIESLAVAGPAARLHLLIGDWPGGDRQLPNATHIRFRGAATIVSDPPGGSFGLQQQLNSPVQLDRDPPASLIDDVCRRVGAQAAAASTLRLTDLLPTETWPSDGSDGLVTTVGLTGHAPLSLRLNDLTPHWLIGGRSGSGKTAFLINVLYGLCSRYSPDDLTLYLLDFKEGVSFREFTPTDRDPSWIPHARAVGIESDRAYGLAVLRELDTEMTRRSLLFKDAGVTRFADLRETMPLARIVCVIDEFQVLLGGDDRLARQAVSLLESVARKGRSYGIHLILASQTLRGVEALYTKRDSIFGQFPVRIALPGGGDVLDARNSAAEALRLGTAIVNTAGGLGGPTGASRAHERLVDFPDPHAEPKTLATLRRRLWLARPAGSLPPFIFEGNAPQALPHRIPRSRRPAAYLGRSIDVELTAATFPMDATPGRHIAVIGPSDGGTDVLDAATRSLAAQHEPGSVRFVLAPLVAVADEVGARLAASLTADGHPVDVVDVAGLRAVLDAAPPDTYVVGFGMDGVGVDLRRILRDGPSSRTHVIGWWRGLRRFGEDTGGSAGRDDVAGIVLLNVPSTDAALFLGEADLDWQPGPYRALLHDRHVSRTEVIVPFARTVHDVDEVDA